MADRVRPYLFYDVAISICSVCYRKVEGKIVFEGDDVFMIKRCPSHGWEKVLIADDIAYYKKSREVFLKPPEQANHYNTPIRYGCPYDCGLCPDHEQHSCVTLLEITDGCNLSCPICYADSGPSRLQFRSLEQIERMLEAVVRNEREPDVVQVSGGEPTLHPDFFAVLDSARRHPIRHLMVNTNGIRLAQDADFARRLSQYGPAFELYLQFDSFERDALIELRGADLRDVRRRALDRCNELDIPVTLVSTIKKGVNDDEIGKIIDFAVTQPCVRGVTLQPIQAAGRLERFDSARDRLTLTEVRRRILTQSSLFADADVLPVPCHPDCLAMAYALKMEGKVIPLSGMVPVETIIQGARNTINLEEETTLRERVFGLFATNLSPATQATSLKELLCCLPRLEVPELSYRNVFRVLVVQFIDAHSFDVRSVKKTCVHIVHPDGRLIPFDTYNLFYRDGLEQSRLGPIRQAVQSDERRMTLRVVS